MSLDPTTLLIGVAAGGAAGLGISYASFYPRRRNRKVQVTQRDESGQLRKKTVTADDLEKSRREMRTLLLERDLLSAALTKIYEAENEGKITREEREMIAKRYSSQIRDMESKLSDKELIVEVGELEGLRDELVTLFREKIQNIESRLDQAKERLPSASQQQAKGTEASMAVGARSKSASQLAATVTAQSSQTDDLERIVERKAPRRDDTEGERRVKAIRDEVMEALERLEQIDSRKENDSS
ncbi:MAG TPA: hypothetical protein VND40_01275 [Nitrososphaerales archaeon]|nr:hypothetical protein [Nitrososphaerales archaeon]